MKETLKCAPVPVVYGKELHGVEYLRPDIL
jgi:hypothetical protein